MVRSDSAIDPHVQARDAGFAQLADASPAYIWILDAAGSVIHANGAARSLQPTDENKRNVCWPSLWPDTNRFSVDRALSEANAGRPFRFRTRFRTGDGADIYLDTTASPIRDANGRIQRLLIKAEDVTAQVETAAFLNTVIDVLPLALTVKDARTGRYILANRAAEALFDQPDGLAGLRPADVLPVPFAAWEARPHVNPAELQSALHHDVTPRRERWLSAVKVATYDDDGVRHVIGLTEDVTRRRRDDDALLLALDQARQAERARAAFLSNISHELRTPLNGVIAGLDLIASRGGHGQAEVLEMIRGSAATLERRLADLMRMAQLEAPEDAPRLRTFDPRTLLEALADRYRDAAAAKSLTIDAACAIDAPLVGDRDCLEEALSRLVDNAVKFSDRGRIRLTAERLEDGRIRFVVEDEGVGFDPLLKDRLFEGFQKQDDTLTRRHGGLGLGLAIAREAARRLDGTLDAMSNPGAGSRFWLDVALSASQAADPAPAVMDAAGRLQVLVADDHPTNRRIVELMLEGVADVTSVEDGLAAVEAAAATRFDVILMDIQMPRMDGIAAVAAIRAAEDQTARTPIVMLTANTQAEHIAASRTAGADRHVGKPFTAAVLLDAIEAVLDDAARNPAPGGPSELSAGAA